MLKHMYNRRAKGGSSVMYNPLVSVKNHVMPLNKDKQAIVKIKVKV